MAKPQCRAMKIARAATKPMATWSRRKERMALVEVEDLF